MQRLKKNFSSKLKELQENFKRALNFAFESLVTREYLYNILLFHFSFPWSSRNAHQIKGLKLLLKLGIQSILSSSPNVCILHLGSRRCQEKDVNMFSVTFETYIYSEPFFFLPSSLYPQNSCILWVTASVFLGVPIPESCSDNGEHVVVCGTHVEWWVGTLRTLLNTKESGSVV